MGNDEDVARRIGIPVERRTFAALLLSGLLAAAAGVMYTMQVAVSTAKIGEGMEFTPSPPSWSAAFRFSAGVGTFSHPSF